MMPFSSQRFHGYGERITKQNTSGVKNVVTQTRELSCRFHNHYHPFTQEMDDRLIQGSTPGLQAADTEYATRAILQAAVTVSFQASPLAATITRTLAANDAVRLPDGTNLQLANGDMATFRCHAVVLDGVLNGDAGERVRLMPNSLVTLPRLTLVESENGERLRLDAAVAVIIPSGNPRPRLFEDFFAGRYSPADAPPTDGTVKPGAFVDPRHPVRELDFTPEGAYSVYNWETFCHSLWLMAVHHSRNKNFEAAEVCFRYLFDATDSSEGATPERFWKVQPFQTTEVRQLEEILTNLATNADPELRERTLRSIEAWQDAPFRPFVVARFRQSAFMFGVLMAYFDHKIAWGDYLFRSDNPENIERARLEYICVANLLGPRPQPVPRKGSIAPRTYAMLKDHLHKFGTALEQLESDLPFDLAPLPLDAVGDSAQHRTLSSIGRGLYFCVPRNDKLLGYWDTIADRLFKIRNSLNLQGIFRRLPLFPPPFDPMLLLRAAASGLDISAIASGLNQPLALVRFQLLVQKAVEICQEVKSLGSNLLSVIEKQDNEALAILRARHESAILSLIKVVRDKQVTEAKQQRLALMVSLENAKQRYRYYEGQFGVSEKDSSAKLKEAEVTGFSSLRRAIEIDVASSEVTEGRVVSSYEKKELERLDTALDWQSRASELEASGAFFNILPSISGNFEPLGNGVSISFGGSNLAAVDNSLASRGRGNANARSHEAATAAKMGGYWRREQEWAFQSNLAVGEIKQFHIQIIAAEIREQIASLELSNHQRQISHAKEISDFLTTESYTDPDGQEQHGKTTNPGFYAWMRREVQGLHSQCFDFAFEVAKKAERALQHELGDFSQTFIQYDYASGLEGLLAGEKLHLDLKRMEMAYLDLNRREYELTKHVSLLQVAPVALIQLRATGRCTLALPEELFDMDGPGHYFRRIKTVAISVPCVTGPYASVNCTATLVKSSVRTSGVAGGDGYARTGADDSRFNDHFGSTQSIVTSTAQNDSGLFETNLRDERYLPFEGAGAVSEWELQLPANPSNDEPPQFDYDTISDVILHVRYTAREGGGLLRNGAIANVKDLIKAAQAIGSVRLFSVRHEFPSEWAKFLSQPPAAGQRFELKINLRPEHYPFWSKDRLNGVTRVDILGQSTVPGSVNVADKLDKNDATAQTDLLSKGSALGNLLVGKLTNIGLPTKPDRELKLFVDSKAFSDFWLAVTWNE